MDLQQVTASNFTEVTGKVHIEQRSLSKRELEAMDEARALGADGIANAPVSLAGIFNYINSVRYGGKAIFARIETASETSKYQTGSEILAIYSTAFIYNVAERVHGCRIAEIQLDCGDYMCTDMEIPYKPQPAYYSCGFSKRSLIQWKDMGEMNNAQFVTMLLIKLRTAMTEVATKALDVLIYSQASINQPISSGMAKRQCKQLMEDLEKHVKKEF